MTIRNIIILIGFLLLGASLPRIAGLFDDAELTPIDSTPPKSQPPYRPYGEFETTEAVVISELTLSNFDSGYILAQQILASGVDLIIMTEEPKAFQDKTGFLEDYRIDPSLSERIHPIEVSHGSPWVRDFGGVFYFYDSKKLGMIRRLGNFTYRHESYLEDTVPFQLALYLSTSVESIPFMFDGGNFMTDGERCYIAAAVLLQDDNDDFDNVTPEQIRFIETYFKERIGCRHLTIIDEYPHEHIDMWVKIINKGQALVNTIPEPWQSTTDHQDIQRQLDIAAEILSRDFQVTRIPMLPPEGERFPTYTNASIINDKVLIPSYRRPAIGDDASNIEWPEPEELGRIEAEVERIYRSFGFDVFWVPSDEFADNGGAVHCLSLQIPKDTAQRRPINAHSRD